MTYIFSKKFFSKSHIDLSSWIISKLFIFNLIHCLLQSLFPQFRYPHCISALIYVSIPHIIWYIDHILRQIWCERVRPIRKRGMKKWIEGSEFGTNAICHNIWEWEKKRDVPKLTSYEYRIDSAECKTLKSTKNRLKIEKLILSWFCRIFPDISFSNLCENRLLKNCERDMRMEKPGAKQLKRLKKVTILKWKRS